MNSAYRWWSALVVLLVVLQVGFAGYGAFRVANRSDDGTVNSDYFEDSFGPHGLGALLVAVSILVLVVLALLRTPRKPWIWWALILVGLFVLQAILAGVGFEVPAVGALHPINALVIFGVSAWNAWNAWGGRAGEPARVPIT